MSVDPLVLGNVRKTIASFICDGETAVLVRALTDAQVEFADRTLRQYSPIVVDTIPLAAGPKVVHALSDRGPTTADNRESEPRRRGAVPSISDRPGREIAGD